MGAANDSWDSFDLDLGADVINIGSHVEPDIEKIIAAEPDLVIASANTDADIKMEKLLADSGITVAYFSVSNFNEYLNMLEMHRHHRAQRPLCPERHSGAGAG